MRIEQVPSGTMSTKSDAWREALAEELRAARARNRNMTQQELSRRTGIPQVSLQRYLSGERDVKIPDLAAICRALNIRIGDVVHAVEERLAADPPMPDVGTGRRSG